MSKEPNNTVLARRVSLDLTPTGFGDRHSAVKLPTHEEQEAEYRYRNGFPLQVPLTGFEPATSCYPWSDALSTELQGRPPDSFQPSGTVATDLESAADGRKAGSGLDFTANIEDKRDHVDPLWMCSMFGHKPAC